MKTALNAAIVLALALAVGACGHDVVSSPVGPTMPGTGTLVVTVISAGRPVSEAEVSVSGPAESKQSKTDAGGQARFAGLALGEYRVVVYGFGIAEMTRVLSLDKGEVQITIEVARKNDVEMVSTTPSCGSTVSYDDDGQIVGQFRYYLAQTVVGHRVAVEWGFSVNGVGMTGSANSAISAESGVVVRDFPLPSRDVKRTSYVINRIIVKELLGPVLDVLAEKVTPCEFTFQ